MTPASSHDFLSAVDDHLRDYRKQFKAARREISEESVHDLRVAVRRFLAILGFVRNLDADPRVRKLRRFFKWQLGQLDELRDAQVMLIDATKTTDVLPELQGFRDYLKKRSAKLSRSAQKDMDKSRPRQLKDRIKRVRGIVEQHAEDTGLIDQLLRTVDQAYSKTIRAFRRLNAGDPASIHRIRVAFKNFRYMVETMQPFLPNYPEDGLEQMRNYQDVMGQVHDTTVFLDQLEQFPIDLPNHQEGHATTFDPKAIEAYYRQRLDEQIQAYLARKDEIELFWRRSTNESFPWERDHAPLHRSPRNSRAKHQSQQRAAGQPASTDGLGAQEDAPYRPRAKRAGATDRGRPDQPLHSGG